MLLQVYNLTFLLPQGDLETFTLTFSVFFKQYGSLLYFVSIIVKVPC
jgi:hypothetical protein